MKCEKRWIVKLGLLFCSGAVSMAVGAATLASSSVSDLRFQLIDLAPDDGVVPSVVWTSTLTSVEVTRQSGQVVEFFPQSDGTLLWGVSFSITESDSRDASGFLLQPLSAGLPSASVSVGADFVSAHADASLGGLFLSTFGFASGTFSLTANTELRVMGTLFTSTEGPSSDGFVNPPGIESNVGIPFSQGYAYAEVFLAGVSAVRTASGTSNTPNTAPQTFSTAAYSSTEAGPIELSFRNTSAAEATGQLYVLTQVTTLEIASPVPEPTTWLMLVVGFAVLLLRNPRHQHMVID